MTTLLVAGAVVLAILIPLSGVLTIILFWWNPFRASMFAALQLVVAAGARVALGQYSAMLTFEADLGFATLRNSTLTLTSGSSELSGYVVLGAALVVYVVAAMRVPAGREV
jgi:hypothetical protein